VALTEDLAPFFDTAYGFAVAATYDGASPVSVIFDNAYLEQLGIAGTGPVALVRASQVAADPTGKTLAIGAQTYLIRNVRPMDDGAVVLLNLQEQ
jgi:hypothetical protein